MKRFLFTLLFLLCSSTIADARTWYVAPAPTGDNSRSCFQARTQGTPKATPQQAINCIRDDGGAAGDSVEIASGTYNDLIEIGLTGTWPTGTSLDANPITIRAAPGATVTILSTSSGYDRTWRIYGGNMFYVFQDIILDASNGKGGFYFAANFVRCVRCEAKNVMHNITAPTWAAGVHVIGNNIEFIGGSVHHNGDTVAPFTFVDQAPYGFYWQGDNGLIDGVDCYNNGAFCVHGYNGNTANSPANLVVRNNRVHNNGLSYWQTPSTRRSSTALFSRGPGNKFYNNVVYGGTLQGGIFVDSSVSPSAIYNNTVSGMPQPGVGIGNGGHSIRNNILVDNVGGNIDRSGASSFTITNNLCFGTGGTTDCTITAQNPLLNANYSIQAGSPAINQGVDLASAIGCTSGSTCTDTTGVTVRPQPLGGNWDIGAYEYVFPTAAPSPQLVLALPLDEGTGTSAVDVSGQRNNATLIGGATWDNAGKYGKAIAFDGSGYLIIPYTPSLALAPAMTLEAWVYPTVAPAEQFFTVIYQGRYWLFSSSSSGSCPTPVAPTAGYAGASVSIICATSVPPLNQWSHLAMTYDGLNITFYINGNIAASQSSTEPMVPGSDNLTIGRSSNETEYFIGKIDEPRVYNYARNPAQVMSDMNTPLIGAPGKYVEIAAPASVEISSASSIEISAD